MDKYVMVTKRTTAGIKHLMLDEHQFFWGDLFEHLKGSGKETYVAATFTDAQMARATILSLNMADSYDDGVMLVTKERL